MSEIYFCDSSKEDSVCFLKENLEAFGNPVKLISFFYNENFILTRYVLRQPDVHLIIINENEETMQFSGLNCGYLGTSTIKTKELLLELGLTEEQSSMLILQDAIFLKFHYDEFNKMSYTSKNKSLFYTSIREDNLGLCLLDENTQVDLPSRTVMFNRPEKNNINGLLNCVCYARALEIRFSLSDSVRVRYEMKNKINLLIIGEYFDIECSISKKYLYSIIDGLHLFILKKPYFKEERSVSFVVAKIKKLINKLFKSEQKNNVIIMIKERGTENELNRKNFF